MELFTLNNNYEPVLPIDEFISGIWTERVLGDGDFQLLLPATAEVVQRFPYGQMVGSDDSKQIMRTDSTEVKDGILTVKGTALTQHLNSRFIRFTPNRADQSYNITGSPGYILQYLVQNMAIDGAWLNGVSDMGVPTPQILKIGGFSIGDYDQSLPSVTIAVSYGPLYDELKKIASTYNLAMRIDRLGNNDIRFYCWSGVDHTSGNHTLTVRFSNDDDNFDDIREVIDGTNFKTHAYVWASGLTGSGAGYDTPGMETAQGAYDGWDLRAEMVLDSSVKSDTDLADVLNQKAQDALNGARLVGAVDGTVIPPTWEYGVHYNLGDIVEVVGTSGIIVKSRVTEHIHSLDDTGEKRYPTMVAI